MADDTSHLPSPFDSIPRPQSPSMLYSMIPSAVKSRLPKLPSLRRSTSMYGLTPRPKSADSSCLSSGLSTPRTTIGSALVWGGSRAEGELYFTESGMEASEDEHATQVDKSKSRQDAVLHETKSGIGWKFANQGCNLLSLAIEESALISQNSRVGNESFARQLYIHSVIYLLRALPAELTPEEQLSVRSALPHGVVPLQLEGLGNSRSSTSGVANQPSILHRTLASIIVQLFILFQFLLPHLKYLLSSAYQYERTYKISAKVVSGSISTIDTLGKKGLLASEAILKIGDGKMGQLMAHLASWLVEGVAGGIHEGLGEGMVIIGAARPASEVISR